MKKHLSKIIYFSLPPADSLRQKSLRLLCGFLAFMFLFTFLSRSASSLTTAQVTVEQPSDRIIEHKISASGKVIQNRELAVGVEEGLRIRSVYVNVGDTVEKGDVLLELDSSQLQDAISEIEKEIRSLELSNESLDTNREITEQTRQRAIARAKKDYWLAKKEASNAISAARSALNQAKKELQNYKNKKRTSQTKMNSGSSLKNFTASPNLWNTEQSRETGKQYPSDENSEETNNDGQSASDNNQIKNSSQPAAPTRKELEENVTEKQKLYEEVRKTQNAAVETAKRALEDASVPSSVDRTDEINDLSIASYEKKLQKLEKLQKKNGKILAPTDGVITNVMAVTGNKTTDEAAFLMADLRSGVRFIAQFSKKDEKYLSKDAKAVLIPDNGGAAVTDLSISSVTVDSTDNSLLNAAILLKKDTLSIGQTAEMNITQKSQKYSSTVSLSALREENGQYYVLTIQKKETTLGEEWFARRVDISILDKNNSFAALEEGVLHEEDSIIISSNKSIEDGDRIRLAE